MIDHPIPITSTAILIQQINHSTPNAPSPISTNYFRRMSPVAAFPHCSSATPSSPNKFEFRPRRRLPSLCCLFCSVPSGQSQKKGAKQFEFGTSLSSKNRPPRRTNQQGNLLDKLRICQEQVKLSKMAGTDSELASISETTSFEQLFRWALLQVSVDTMAITALPLDCWLKERLKNWVQLSGHEGTIVPASNHTLWKKQPKGSQTEARAYEQIMRDPELRGITPKFYKEIVHNYESFIEIQDLLAQFQDAKRRAIMDIKIGTRTFMESEVNNGTKRVDLYHKMVALAPDEPTEEEKEEGKVTKLRYMQFRERESSSATLGFRIEAAQLPGGKLQKNFKKVKSRRRVRQTLVEFFDGRADEFGPQLADRFRHIRAAVERSEFFRTHEVVGSSLLIIYDQKHIGAWLIDFAKCTPMDDGRTLTHRTPWTLGNHEDGCLTGLDNLIEVLEDKN